jgi:TorA maturation chaperone TorD
LDGSESLSQENIPDEEPRGSHESDLASSLEEQKKINLAREGIYSFLSRAFMYEVDIEFLTMIAAAQPVIELLASSQHGAELKKASEILATTSSKAAALEGEEKKKLLTDLAVEYASFFLVSATPGVYPKIRERVYPWESAYFTEPPRMHAEPYHQVIQAYKSVGYEKPKEFKEPEDHVAAELEFMAHLCRLTRASIDSGKVDFALGYVKLQKEFLGDHLLQWVGKFSERLKKNAQKGETDFYYALAMLLESFITMDNQTLDHIAAELKQRTGGGQEESASHVFRDS